MSDFVKFRRLNNATSATIKAAILITHNHGDTAVVVAPASQLFVVAPPVLSSVNGAGFSLSSPSCVHITTCAYVYPFQINTVCTKSKICHL
ncbi:hypothetical protein NRV38_001054 [Staphylococcus pseudintermedius]|nr:hypothetical protein [Staphylococcus pseudintermedius]